MKEGDLLSQLFPSWSLHQFATAVWAGVFHLLGALLAKSAFIRTDHGSRIRR
jgi:hypothetical protein